MTGKPSKQAKSVQPKSENAPKVPSTYRRTDANPFVHVDSLDNKQVFANPARFDYIEVDETDRIVFFIKQYSAGIYSHMSLSFSTQPEAFKDMLGYLGYAPTRIEQLTKPTTTPTRGN